MLRRRWIALPVLALLVAITGCATILSGTSQSISVSSNVEGAEVFLDGVQFGVTPFTGPVPKGGDQLRLELDGYRSETIQLSTSLEPVFWGNIILGGTLGSLTDFLSDAAYQYAPASYQVDLQRSDQATADYEHEVALRKFAMVYIDELAGDLSEGGGAYSDMLIDIVAMRGTTSATTGDIRTALETSRGNPIVFGNEIADLRF